MAEGKQIHQRKIPQRQCLGCSEHKPKTELLRVVLSPDGTVSLDFTGKKPGRGAYICREVKCLVKAQKSKRLEKSFGCVIPDEVYARLSAELENGSNERS